MTKSSLKRKLISLINKCYNKFKIENDILIITEKVVDELLNNDYKRYIEKNIKGWASSIIIVVDDHITFYLEKEEPFFDDGEIQNFFNIHEQECTIPLQLLWEFLDKTNFIIKEASKIYNQRENQAELLEFPNEMNQLNALESNESLIEPNQRLLLERVHKWIEEYLIQIQEKYENFEEEDIDFMFDALMTFTNLSYIMANVVNPSDWNIETVNKIYLEAIPYHMPMNDNMIDVLPNILGSFFNFIHDNNQIREDSGIENPHELGEFIKNHQEEFKERAKDPNYWSKMKRFTQNNIEKMQQLTKGELRPGSEDDLGEFEREFLTTMLESVGEELFDKEEEEEDYELEMSLEDKEILKKQKITKKNPGNLLIELERFLDYIDKNKIVLTNTKKNITAKDIRKINDILYEPIQTDYSRPTQKTYPNIDVLYYITINAGLCVIDNKGSTKEYLVLNKPVYNSWVQLNNTEKYFNLLELILKDTNAEGLLRRNKRNINWFLDRTMHLFSRLEKIEVITDDVLYFDDYIIIVLLKFFGIMKVESRKPKKGKGWSIKELNLTRYGKALMNLLLDIFHSTNKQNIVEKLLMMIKTSSNPYDNEDIESIEIQEILREYFPEWKKKLFNPIEEEETKEGTYIFKISLSNKIWRKVAMNSDDLLDDLAYIICHVFDFDFDHLYRFTHRNKYRKERSYNHPYEEKVPTTDTVKIKDLKMSPSDNLTFIYDFGDWWEFQIKLEKIEPQNKKKEEQILIDEKGDSPDQYGY